MQAVSARIETLLRDSQQRSREVGGLHEAQAGLEDPANEGEAGHPLFDIAAERLAVGDVVEPGRVGLHRRLEDDGDEIVRRGPVDVPIEPLEGAEDLLRGGASLVDLAPPLQHHLLEVPLFGGEQHVAADLGQRVVAERSRLNGLLAVAAVDPGLDLLAALS